MCAEATQRVEFRVICRYTDGTELPFKITDSLEDAIRSVKPLEQRFRGRLTWRIYEATISETLKLAYEV